jgi:glyoxylase-like metal-dependent hydrolase (beta-lactamase superfamily II)
MSAAAVPAPQVREVAPGVHWIVGAGRAAHSYLLRGSRRNVLVDTGLPTTTGYLEACLATLGLRPEDLDLVLLTHEHIDHSGGASFFGQHCVVGAHPHAANKLQMADDFSMMSRVFAETAVAYAPDLLLVEGAGIDLGNLHVDVVHTPGHCSGSVCLYESRNRLLLSADTIMARGVLGGVVLSGNVSDYMTSLQKLQRLRVDLLLPGHGKVSKEPQADLDVGLSRLRGLLEDSHALFTAMRGTDQGFDEISRSLRDLNAL